jgi:hypothetical protein
LTTKVCAIIQITPHINFIFEGRESDWVSLNVGGRTFSTTRSTLTKDKDSMLAKMFGDNWQSTTDAAGSYLIDRTPEYFAPILNYLRCGVLVIDDGVNAEGIVPFVTVPNIRCHNKYL